MFKPTAFVFVSTMLLGASAANADSLIIDASASGGYHANGAFTLSGGNYAVGWYPTASPSGELRNYVVFDMSALSGTVVSATLRLFNSAIGYSSPDASETFALFDVNTSIAGLTANVASTAIFNDLGNGTSLGSTTVNSQPNPNSTNIDVIFNADGLNYLNNALGSSVAIGGAITSIDYTNLTSSERLFNATSSLLTRQLILDILPIDQEDPTGPSVPGNNPPPTHAVPTPAAVVPGLALLTALAARRRRTR